MKQDKGRVAASPHRVPESCFPSFAQGLQGLLLSFQTAVRASCIIEQVIASLYEAPLLGGTPRLLIKDVDSPITFSHDGQRFAYLHTHGDSAFTDLKMAHRDGSPERDLFSHKQVVTDNRTLSWSPDGKSIIIPLVQPTSQDLGGFLLVDVATGEINQVEIAKDRIYYEPSWLADGSALLVSVSTAQTGFLRRQIGLVSYPSGEFRLLTTDTNDYFHPSLAGDGRSIAANQSQGKFQIEIAPSALPQNPRPVKLMSNLSVWSWDWTPDAQLLVIQGPDIRLVNPAGGDRIIFSDSNYPMDHVASCEDGRHVVFRTGGRSGGAEANFWRIDSNGANMKRLTFGVNDRTPICSNDGKWLYFVDAAESHFLKRVPIDGGTPEREKGVDNLWVQPLDPTPRRQLTHFTAEKIAAYSFSKDASRLAVERGHAESDGVLLRSVSK